MLYFHLWYFHIYFPHVISSDNSFIFHTVFPPIYLYISIFFSWFCYHSNHYHFWNGINSFSYVFFHLYHLLSHLSLFHMIYLVTHDFFFTWFEYFHIMLFHLLHLFCDYVIFFSWFINLHMIRLFSLVFFSPQDSYIKIFFSCLKDMTSQTSL